MGETRITVGDRFRPYGKDEQGGVVVAIEKDDNDFQCVCGSSIVYLQLDNGVVAKFYDKHLSEAMREKEVVKKSQLKVIWNNNRYNLRATIYPMGDKTREQRWFHCDVTRRNRGYREPDWEPAEVSWSSYGAQTDLDIVKAYSEGLKKAAEIANTMNSWVRLYKVTLAIKEKWFTRIVDVACSGNWHYQIYGKELPKGIEIVSVIEIPSDSKLESI